MHNFEFGFSVQWSQELRCGSETPVVLESWVQTGLNAETFSERKWEICYLHLFISLSLSHFSDIKQSLEKVTVFSPTFLCSKWWIKSPSDSFLLETICLLSTTIATQVPNYILSIKYCDISLLNVSFQVHFPGINLVGCISPFTQTLFLTLI